MGKRTGFSKAAFLAGCLSGLVVTALAGVASAGTPVQAPSASFVTAGGKTLTTAQLGGHPTMLWLLSTWCGSCGAGLQTLARHANALEAMGLQIVVLRNYRNDGYAGMHITKFVATVLPGFKPPKNWTLGQASMQLGQRYNARGYPDIYFLIDAQERIQAVDSAPSATLDKILAFARSQSKVQG